MKPEDLVEALQALIKISRTPGGPTFDEAIDLASSLDVPQEWIVSLLFGWEDYAKRWKKPLLRELVTHGGARFLSSRALRGICLGKPARTCTLCGQPVSPPQQSWHKECWAALEPHTSYGWKKICRRELKHSGVACRLCEVSIVRGNYHFDHILPVALGGKNIAENIQVLCLTCHKEKTKEDMKLIRQSRAS